MKIFFTQFILTFLIFPLSALATDISVVLEGQGRFVLTSPAAEQLGSEGLDVYEEIASSSLQLTSRGQSAYIAGSAQGTYNLVISGHTYDRNASLSITASSSRYEFDIMTHTDRSTFWDIDVASTTVASLHFTAPILDHRDSNDTVELLWNKNQNAEAYTIYRKAWDFPFYEHFAITSTTTFQTGDSWGTVLDERETIPTDWYSYRVTWTDIDGNESVLSNTVSNSDRDQDGFTDWREINSYSTDPELTDTDGDTLGDFLEINTYSTDPNDPDTDGDSYTDGEEVEQRTNPIDPQSYPTSDTVCEQDAEGNWLITSDCVIDTYTEATGNITIFSDALLSIQNTASLLIDLTQYYIKIITGGTLQIEEGSSLGD